MLSAAGTPPTRLRWPAAPEPPLGCPSPELPPPPCCWLCRVVRPAASIETSAVTFWIWQMQKGSLG